MLAEYKLRQWFLFSQIWNRIRAQVPAPGYLVKGVDCPVKKIG